jgi:glutamate 5-kinase
MNSMSMERYKDAAEQLAAAKRVVIKIGSSILCGENGVLRKDWLFTVGGDIGVLRKRGIDVVVVTSGAIALGRKRLGLGRALRLDEKQAASAAGQAALVEAWRQALEPEKIQIAQILLTLDDMENRRRYLNARATFRTLIELGTLPLVNENDTVATSEIRYGDNDRLAAHVAQLIESDVLVMLSDVDGVYSADPRRDRTASHIAAIDAVTPDIESAAAGPNAAIGVGSGGMASKIAAAKIASANGCAAIIAAGAIDHPLRAIENGARSTLIRPSEDLENARKQWIAGRLKPAGAVKIDAGAAAALSEGASLLPAGVTEVRGAFERGDAVEIVAQNGDILGKGLSAYYAHELRQIAGKRSSEIESILGYRRRPAVIEKNDLALRKGTRHERD